jgi:hypothetical protein
MTSEQYVKQFYPDAFCDYSKRYEAFAVAVEIEGEQIIIGKSEFFERIAWKNAKDWLDSLPADNKPEKTLNQNH